MVSFEMARNVRKGTVNEYKVIMYTCVVRVWYTVLHNATYIATVQLQVCIISDIILSYDHTDIARKEYLTYWHKFY